MPDKSVIYKLTLLFVIVAGAALFFYTNFRAATLSLTHDEGVIYQLISQNSPWKIFNYVIPQDHMINSFLMKISCQHLRDSEYVLRLPNLLGHLLYIIFSILLLLKLKNPHLLAAGFVLLNFNPYLLDFFSIARGYGLSVSFMMVSIYYGYSFLKSKKVLHLGMAFLFAVIAVLTVYTLLNYIIALCAVVAIMMLIWWSSEKFTLDKKYLLTYGKYLLVIVLSIAFLFMMLYEPLQRVQSEQFIYQAFDSDFYHGTLHSIFFRSTFNSDFTIMVDFLAYGFTALFSSAFVIMIILSLRKNYNFTRRLMFVSVCLMSIIAVSVSMQNWLLNIRFLENRAATFIIPVMALIIIGIGDELFHIINIKIPALMLIYGIAVLFLVNTLYNANFKWYLDWKYDASTREMMQDLCHDAETIQAEEIKFGIVWLYEPSVNFYRKIWNLKWLKAVDRNGYDGDFDYYYVDDEESILSKDIFKSKAILKRYMKTQTVLIKSVP